jgi:hypothetical protein
MVKMFLVSFLFSCLLISGCDRKELEKGSESYKEALPANLPGNERSQFPEALPEGNAFRDIQNALKVRADKGDISAACQFAREAEFCSGVQWQVRDLELAMAKTAGKNTGDSAGKSYLATVSELAREKAKYCENARLPTSSERMKYWYQAAVGGHLPSMVYYASGRAFRQGEILDNLDNLRIYKANALPMMNKAVQAGSVQAAISLAKGYSSLPTYRARSGMIGELIPQKDDRKALAYFLLAKHMLQGESKPDATSSLLEADTAVGRLTEFLDPASIADAERDFQTMASAWNGSADADAGLDGDVNASAPSTKGCVATKFDIAT